MNGVDTYTLKGKMLLEPQHRRPCTCRVLAVASRFYGDRRKAFLPCGSAGLAPASFVYCAARPVSPIIGSLFAPALACCRSSTESYEQTGAACIRKPDAAKSRMKGCKLSLKPSMCDVNGDATVLYLGMATVWLWGGGSENETTNLFSVCTARAVGSDMVRLLISTNGYSNKKRIVQFASNITTQHTQFRTEYRYIPYT